jgi:DNA-binding NtrC family response regulator
VPTSLKGKTILVIDDEECMRDSCRQALTKAGYDVETAIDGEAGLAKAREIGPDVALVDLDMPGPHGLEVMDRLNEMSPDTIRILVTGNTSLDLEEEAIGKRRALYYLAKPFTPDELNLVVRKALDSRDPMKMKGKEDCHGS